MYRIKEKIVLPTNLFIALIKLDIYQKHQIKEHV